MMQYLRTWAELVKREEGQDVAEYALIISFIAIALVLVISALAGGVANSFNNVRNVLQSSGSSLIPT